MGSGKSTVGEMFAGLGVPVYNSDVEAKRLMGQSGEIKNAIEALIGKEAYEGNKPRRKVIAEKVFADSTLLEGLNAIIHPAVKRDFETWRKQQSAPYLIQEAAILFENGSYGKFDKIILVCAPKEERIRRIRARDGSSRMAVEARMAHQWDDARKAALADFVIENHDLGKTRSEVHLIHRKLMELSG
jgi:dephospho-CoA kinase